MWQMLMAGVLAGVSQFSKNRTTSAQHNMAASQADLNAKLADLNFNRRVMYNSEEMAQQVWNISQQSLEFAGVQRAAMANSQFAISTGDQRILEDTISRGMDRAAGINRTYYLQMFEDNLQTRNDIAQYNFDAYANRMMAKQYSGWRGALRTGTSALTAALGAYQPSGKKGNVSSNTWEGSGQNLNKDNKLSLSYGKESSFGLDNPMDKIKTPKISSWNF